MKGPRSQPYSPILLLEHAFEPLCCICGFVVVAAALVHQPTPVRVTIDSTIRDDLKMYPSNMWGLLGLRQCLDKAGKGGDPEVHRTHLFHLETTLDELQ